MSEDSSQSCPKCQSKLIHISPGGMVIELCSSCGGTWFDAGELTMLIKVYKEFGPEDGEESVGCLRCEGTMREIAFPGTDVKIDRCPKCAGVWLDKGELEILQRELGKLLPPEQNFQERARELLTEVERAREARFKCPKCEGRLWHLRRQGIFYEMCSQCSGIWFDAGELTMLLQIYKDFDPEAGEASSANCLRCDSGMREYTFPNTDVKIDRCPSCQGVWLDKGEFGQLRDQLSAIVNKDEPSYNERAKVLLENVEEAAASRLICPKCEDQPLKDVVRAGVQTERCVDCDGTWFDSGELTVVLGVSTRIRVRKGEKTELWCIKCPKELLVELPYPGTEILIDACPDCRSIWLDGGEFESLAEALGVTLAGAEKEA